MKNVNVKRCRETQILISQTHVYGLEASPWPSALNARGLDFRVLLELLIIRLPDPPNSS